MCHKCRQTRKYNHNGLTDLVDTIFNFGREKETKKEDKKPEAKVEMVKTN